ncbi:MAG: hypothetical protein Kow001_21280 [Acidobacteriota bacterium]
MPGLASGACRVLSTVWVIACLGGSFSLAASQKALSYSGEDPRLQWGPRPAFMPEGCQIAVLHGNPAENNTDVFFKLPAGVAFPRHWHTSAERMVLISGELHVTYDGQPTVVLKEGSYAYGPAKLPHEGRCAGDEPCLLFIAFELPVDAVPGEEQP